MSTRHHPYPRALVLTATVVSIGLALGLLLLKALNPVGARAASTLQATVVVQLDDSSRLARVISFTNPISGLRALDLSGLDFVTKEFSFGAAVCAIEGVGCPTENCFCDSKFWAYSYWDGSTWQGYSVGAGSSVISQTGAVEGWYWSEFGSPAAPYTPTRQALDGLEWLRAQQPVSGTFGSVGATLESLLAVGANREDAETLRRLPDGVTADNFVAVQGGQFSRTSAGASG